MTERTTSPNIYLMRTCPFCLKLRIFLTEAGLADRFTFVVFDQGDAVHADLRGRMESGGQQPGFPAAELSPGILTTETNELIARFAGEAGVDPSSMPLLRYYSEGVFGQHLTMFRELRDLREAGAGRSA